MAERLEIEITSDSSQARGDLGSLTRILGGLGSLASGLFTAGLGVATAGILALGSGLGFALNEAIDAQVVLAQTNAVIESTGGVAGITAVAASELAGSLSEITRFSDEAILAGENMLLTFTNIGQDIFPEATRTLLDMSTALGQDLTSSAIQLGKALQDPILGVTALRRVGVNFSEAQQAVIEGLVESGQLMEAQKLILQELQVEFGGSAAAAGQTFAGQLDILRNRLSNVAEEVGNVFLPVIEGAFAALMPTVDTLLAGVQPILDAFRQLFANLEAGMSPVEAFRFAFLNIIPPGFQDLFNAVLDHFRSLELLLRDPEMQAALREIGHALNQAFNDGLIEIMRGLTEQFRTMANFITRNGPAITDTLRGIADLITWISNSGIRDVLGFIAGGGVPGFIGRGAANALMSSGGPSYQANSTNFYGPVSVQQSNASNMTQLMNDLNRAAGN